MFENGFVEQHVLVAGRTDGACSNYPPALVCTVIDSGIGRLDECFESATVAAWLASPPSIKIVEGGPRDGLRNEVQLVSTVDEIALIGRAIDYGAHRIEVTSFVNPRLAPQMADAADLHGFSPRSPGHNPYRLWFEPTG